MGLNCNGGLDLKRLMKYIIAVLLIFLPNFFVVVIVTL